MESRCLGSGFALAEPLGFVSHVIVTLIEEKHGEIPSRALADVWMKLYGVVAGPKMRTVQPVRGNWGGFGSENAFLHERVLV